MKTMQKLKGTFVRVAVGAFLLQLGSGIGYAAPVQIPTGSIDFTVLAAVSAALNSATLVKWRTGVPNQAPQPAASLSFAYLSSGSGLGLPTRTTVLDNTANNQSDLWSDNAIDVSYVKPNNDASAIVIYTNNTDGGATDPLSGVGLRGGLVGGTSPVDPNRASVLPLLWKAVASTDLQAVSTATVSGTNPVPATSPIFMPTEVTALSGGACPAEGPYVASNRTNNGFCDYSTHYFLDKNNTDPNNLWYTGYTDATKKLNAFHYASLVGRLGVNTTEQGAGTAAYQPMYALLGVGAVNAVQTTYASTINVEMINF